MTNTRDFRRYAAATISLALAALLISGCGDGDPGSTVASPQAATSSSGAADPSTLVGGCQVLVGADSLLDQVRAFVTEPGRPDRAAVQEKVFAVVVAGNKKLGDPAGQLVDFLDDPAGYVEGGKLSAPVEAAFTDIRTACSAVAS